MTLTRKAASTIDARDALRATLDALKIRETAGDDRERNGYAGVDILGARGFIGWRATKGNGGESVIELPGAAIDGLRKRKLSDDEIVAIFKGDAWRASRVDFSVDTHNPDVTPDFIAKLWRAGHATCRAENIKNITEERPDGRHSHTVYIGSPTSARMLRVYDKRTQMEFVHKVEPGAPPWTRFELQHRHAAADLALQHMQTYGVQAGKRLLNGWITFTDPKSRVRDACRRPPAPFWEEIVGAKKARSV